MNYSGRTAHPVTRTLGKFSDPEDIASILEKNEMQAEQERLAAKKAAEEKAKAEAEAEAAAKKPAEEKTKKKPKPKPIAKEGQSYLEKFSNYFNFKEKLSSEMGQNTGMSFGGGKKRRKNKSHKIKSSKRRKSKRRRRTKKTKRR